MVASVTFEENVNEIEILPRLPGVCFFYISDGQLPISP